MNPMRILIVDNDHVMRGLLSEYFSRCHQSKAYPTLDSESALKELHRKPYDVILTDINRPGMNGLTFTRMVRLLCGPPVIILTGYYHPRCRRQAFASGARACLPKPTRLPYLAEVVELVVDKGVHYIGEGEKTRRSAIGGGHKPMRHIPKPDIEEPL
ncbi:MAG: response regulator [Proteobacteria bacterium]|nr:response regulator [Pseudomonadota bacterium]MBU4472099.1 response regulator [Pseudomonadota bacterium]MCG2752902.1 response regulator [Desulfobacteraceae bacterium]